tara:strand:+ start:3830 stop:4831 length:1002 start_codon:yes stop_codon:yes gene_type:complete
MNNNIIQPLSSIVLHIRSKDADQLTENYNTHLSINLINPINITKNQEAHISIMSVEIPYSFYNISAELKNNTLVYDSTTLTLTSQDYSVYELRDFFNNDTSFSAIFTTTYDIQKNKLNFKNITGSSHTIKLSTSLINKVIGFDETTTDRTITAGSTLSSDFVCNLATVHSILIKSSMGQANVLSTRAGNSTTLQKISVDVNSNGIIYMNQQDFRQISISQSNVIDLITFELTDQNNNLLQLQNVNFEFSILFEIYPRYRIEQRKIISNNQNQVNNIPNQRFILNRPVALTQLGATVNEIDENELDNTHPFEKKSEIKHKADRLILDQLIEQLS